MITTKEIQDLIEMIKSYDKTESYFSYPFIRNALNEILFPVPSIKITKGRKLIRGRVHKNQESFFLKISDISFNRQKFLIDDFGRANEPCQSVFYCSDNLVTAFNETCTIARENLDKDSEMITWGIWEVMKDLEISYVIGTPEKTENTTLSSLTKSFLEFLKDSEEREQILLLHTFISEQFQVKANGHHSLYKISCAFANWIYKQEFVDQNNRKIENAGIIYKSSIWPNEGINIALKSEIIEDGLLKLIEVRRDNIIRHGSFYEGSNTISAKEIDIENNKINWDYLV